MTRPRYDHAARLRCNISYKCRVGHEYNKTFKDSTEALERLQRLIASELRTRKVAPTDSGNLRFTAHAEMRAIMALDLF